MNEWEAAKVGNLTAILKIASGVQIAPKWEILPHHYANQLSIATTIIRRQDPANGAY